MGGNVHNQIFIVAQMIITELESFSNDIEFLHTNSRYLIGLLQYYNAFPMFIQ